jgi:hypothetical protein
MGEHLLTQISHDISVGYKTLSRVLHTPSCLETAAIVSPEISFPQNFPQWQERHQEMSLPERP